MWVIISITYANFPPHYVVNLGTIIIDDEIPLFIPSVSIHKAPKEMQWWAIIFAQWMHSHHTIHKRSVWKMKAIYNTCIAEESDKKCEIKWPNLKYVLFASVYTGYITNITKPQEDAKISIHLSLLGWV
jgi:hypothetical protein